MKEAVKFAIIGGLLFTLVTIAGCAGVPTPAATQPPQTEAPAEAAPEEATEAAQEEAAEEPAEQVTIQFASWQWAEAGRGDELWAVIDQFNQEQDRITVEQLTVPYPTFGETLITQMAGGTSPDIMIMDLGMLVQASEGDFFTPVDDLIDLSQYSLLPVPEVAKTPDGKQLAVPWEVLGYRLIVNEDLLEQAGVEAPTNYEEFLSVAEQLTTEDQFGFAYRHTMPEAGGWWYDLSNWVFGQGGRWSTPDGTPTFNSPEVVEGVRKYKEFYDAGVVPVGTDAATYRRMFWEGKIGMMIDNNAVPNIIKSQNPDIPMQAYPPPFETGNSAGITGFLLIPKDSPNQEAAVELMQFILREDIQEQLAVAFGGTLPGTGASVPEDYIAENPWLPAYYAGGDDYIDVVPNGLETYFSDIRTIVLEQVSEVLISDVDPQEAMDTAQALIEELIAE